MTSEPLRRLLEVFDTGEWAQADDVDRQAWLDRLAVDRELERRADRRGDPQ